MLDSNEFLAFYDWRANKSSQFAQALRAYMPIRTWHKFTTYICFRKFDKLLSKNHTRWLTRENRLLTGPLWNPLVSYRILDRFSSLVYELKSDLRIMNIFIWRSIVRKMNKGQKSISFIVYDWLRRVLNRYSNSKATA